MNQGQLTSALLSETAASVLADCAFLMLDPAPELPPFAGDAVATTLAFSGSVSGSLRLCAAREMLIGAAADMLGVAPDDDEATGLAVAALAELGNVLLGVLLARAFGAAGCPVIGLPVSESLPAVQQSDAPCRAILVDMEGRPLVASLELGPVRS